MAAVIYDWQRSSETRVIENQFVAMSAEVTEAMRNEIGEHINALRILESTTVAVWNMKQTDDLLCVANTIEEETECQPFVHGLQRDQFSKIAENVIDIIPGIQALEWIPVVRMEERALYEEMAGAYYNDEFQFTKITEDGFKTDDQRPFYYPVYYVEPFEPNRAAFLFNLGSSETRKASIDKASIDLNQVATAKITLVQETSSQSGFLVFDPVARANGELVGFSLAVFRIGDLMQDGVVDLTPHKIQLHVFDQLSEDETFVNTGEDTFVRQDYGDWLVSMEHSTDSAHYILQQEDGLDLETTLRDAQQQAGDTYINTEIKVADRTWVVVVHGTDLLWRDVRTSSPLFFLFTILVLTLLIFVIVFLQTLAQVRRQIHEREEQSLQELKSKKQFRRIANKLISTEEDLKQSRFRLYRIKTSRPLFRSYTIDDIENSLASLKETVQFRDVLKNPVTLELFKDFCVKMKHEEAITFYLDILDFERNVPDKELKNRRHEMIEYYIDNDAPLQVNISSDARTQFLAAKCKRDIFTDIKSEISNLLEENSWHEFMDTPQFTNCLQVLALDVPENPK